MRTTATANDALTWRKSSYSGGPGSDCVEVAHAAGDLLVRDSKDPAGPVLRFQRGEFAAFLAAVRNGRF